MQAAIQKMKKLFPETQSTVMSYSNRLTSEAIEEIVVSMPRISHAFKYRSGQSLFHTE